MRTRTLRLLLTGIALVALGACETAKSSNPLSPSVAGPIPGVSITAPKLLQPASGASLDATSQPLTLTMENASTTGVRPLSYLIEVALDSGFANKVYSRAGVSPGGNGRTSLRLPDALAADRKYFWRARAEDGANSGPYASAVSFTVFTPIEVEAPVLSSPAHGATGVDRTPTFVITNARRSGPAGAVTYTLQIAKHPAFGSLTAQYQVAEGLPKTTKTHSTELAASWRYYWRVRASEASRGVVSAWSETFTFVTAAAPAAPDPGDPGPLPGGTYPNTGPGVINYVKAHWPSYLNAVSTLDRRKANMEFLRDRVIETGLCGGMKLAWNLKRGGPTLSLDYITAYKDGEWIGVDIAQDYDNYRERLNLRWAEAPDDPYATYGKYTNTFSCK